MLRPLTINWWEDVGSDESKWAYPLFLLGTVCYHIRNVANSNIYSCGVVFAFIRHSFLTLRGFGCCTIFFIRCVSSHQILRDNRICVHVIIENVFYTKYMKLDDNQLACIDEILGYSVDFGPSLWFFNSVLVSQALASPVHPSVCLECLHPCVIDCETTETSFMFHTKQK